MATDHHRTSGQQVGGRRSRLDEHASLLGQVSDGRVAELVGLSTTAVAAYRSRRGIPAFTARVVPGSPSARGWSGGQRAWHDVSDGALSAVADALTEIGPATPEQVAIRTGLNVKTVRYVLTAMAYGRLADIVGKRRPDSGLGRPQQVWDVI